MRSGISPASRARVRSSRPLVSTRPSSEVCWPLLSGARLALRAGQAIPRAARRCVERGASLDRDTSAGVALAAMAPVRRRTSAACSSSAERRSSAALQRRRSSATATVRADQRVRADRGDSWARRPGREADTPDRPFRSAGRSANTRIYILDAQASRSRSAWRASSTSAARGGARLSEPAGADGGAVRGDPSPRKRSPLYKTGDLGRWRRTGRSSFSAATTSRSRSAASVSSSARSRRGWRSTPACARRSSWRARTRPARSGWWPTTSRPAFSDAATVEALRAILRRSCRTTWFRRPMSARRFR